LRSLPTIMVAPNGARRTRSDHPALPITVGEVVEQATHCFEAGAGALHAHVRDAHGKHILDAGLYSELIAEMSIKVPGMAIQITTEAVDIYTPSEQRKLVHELMPKAVSVSLTEMLSDNDLDAAREFYQFARDAEIAVQHILYSSQEFGQFLSSIEEGVIPDQHHQCLFVLGRYAKDQESSPSDLDTFITSMTEAETSIDWAVCAFGKNEIACLLDAHKRGGKCRVGFENSLWHANGEIAENNAAKVRELADLISEGNNDVD